MVGICGIVCSMLASFFIAHQGLLLLEPSQSSKLLAAVINRDRQAGETIVLEAEKEEPFEYEEVAGSCFIPVRRSICCAREICPSCLCRCDGEHFMLSEAEFHRLWGSEEQIYLVTDTFGEEGGVLDHHSPASW